MDELKLKIERIGEKQSVVLENVTLFGSEIPAGFQTDGVTSPRLFWSFVVSPYGLGLFAAVKHDFLLSNADKFNAKRRKDIDRQFYHDLIDSGFSPFRACLAWVGVRIWSKFFILREKLK